MSADKIEVGGYCYVPQMIDEPRIVLGVADDVVRIWDFSREVGFSRKWVVPLLPAESS